MLRELLVAIEIEPLETGSAAPLRKRATMFRALSHRNYRVFWIGAFLSNVGTWMQAVAQGWLMLQLTNSSLWLDRKSVVEGKSVDLGGRRIIKKKTNKIVATIRSESPRHHHHRGQRRAARHL